MAEMVCRDCGTPVEYVVGWVWKHKRGSAAAWRCEWCGHVFQMAGMDLFCPECHIGPPLADHLASPIRSEGEESKHEANIRPDPGS